MGPNTATDTGGYIPFGYDVPAAQLFKKIDIFSSRSQQESGIRMGGGMEDGREPIVALDFDSKLLPADLRFDAWRRALASFDLSRRETTPFDAVARVWMLGPLIVTRTSVDPLRYDRPHERIAKDANDHFAFVYLLSGGFEGDYGQGVVASGPGSLTVLDMRRPCWTDAARLDAFVLSMARTAIVPHIGRIDPMAWSPTRGRRRCLVRCWGSWRSRSTD